MSLGTGFFPNNPCIYFDKTRFLTLGNGDPILTPNGKESIPDNREEFSEFLSIFETLIFYTEQSESNMVLLHFSRIRKWFPVLGELFPSYEFYIFGSDEYPSEGNIHYLKNLMRDDFLYLKPIIFCEDVTLTDYKSMNPYLVMGIFEPEEEIEFYDGILLRPIWGERLRLIIKGFSYRIWDRKNMMRMLQYHIFKVRNEYRFFNPLTGERTRSRFDQTAELYLKDQYLQKVNMFDGEMSELDSIIDRQIPQPG